jgi:hypothetical protein
MSDGAWFIVRTIRITHRQSFSEKPGPMDIWLKGLGRLGCETYRPLIREFRRVPKQMLGLKQRQLNFPIVRPCVVPFLPGYIFVRGERAGELKRIPCVADYVRTTGKAPAQISDELVQKMRVREEEGAIPGTLPALIIFSRDDRAMLAGRPFEMTPKLPLADREAALDVKGWALKKALLGAKTIAAVERLARGEYRLKATMEQWDADPWLLNTPGAILIFARDVRCRRARMTT